MDPTPSELQYIQEHIEDTRVPAIIISSITCGVLTCIFVALRFLARWLNRAGFGKDDYCLVVGLVLYLAYIIVLCIGTGYGVGRHILVVNDPRMLTILILCDENLYVVGILLIKYSILLLYRRVFPGQTFYKFLLATALLIMAWALAAFFCDTFTCYPIESQWDSSVKGTCIDYGIVTFIMGIANVIIDFILLGLPLPILWKLQMSTRRKILLSFTLGAGSSACVASIVRITYAKDTLSTFDKTWDSVNVAILSGVEMCTAIIACCVATYRPLVERLFIGDPSSSEGHSFEQSDASSRWRWGKISEQHEIKIELGSRTHSGRSAVGDIEMAPLKNSDTFDVTAGPSGKPTFPSEHWYGSPSQNWRAGVTTNGPQDI